jgi:hypothetical protein
VTSLRQWAANRENAQKSSGPRTEEGKHRSRRNSLRHGLTAETVIESLEDSDDYRAFEAAIIADYDAHTAVERELVLRLASLLWRIRRATGIETDLLRIQAEIIRGREDGCEHAAADCRSAPHPASCSVGRLGCRVLRPVISAPGQDEGADQDLPQSKRQTRDDHERLAMSVSDHSRQLTYCFLRLANLDNTIFDRLARYESRLWRQIVQTMFALEPLRRHRYRFG